MKTFIKIIGYQISLLLIGVVLVQNAICENYLDSKTSSLTKDILMSVDLSRQQLEKQLNATRDSQTALREVSDLLTALSYIGSKNEADLVKRGIDWIVNSKAISTSDPAYWNNQLTDKTIALACIFLSENNYFTSKNIDAVQKLKQKAEGEFYAGVPSRILFATEYALKRYKNKSKFDVLSDLSEDNEKYGVRICAMNLFEQIIDYNKSGIEKDCLMLPFKTDNEIDEFVECHRKMQREFQNLKPSLEKYQKTYKTVQIPKEIASLQRFYAKFFPNGSFANDELENWLEYIRESAIKYRDQWSKVKAKLVPINDINLLKVLNDKVHPADLIDDNRINGNYEIRYKKLFFMLEQTK
jgi:hypothetical protein